MIEKAIRTAATIAALAILVGLTTPVATQAAAPVRSETAEVESEEAVAPAGLWQTLADFWQGLVASVFAGSEDEAEDQGGEENTAGGPPGSGSDQDPTGSDGDEGGGADPNG